MKRDSYANFRGEFFELSWDSRMYLGNERAEWTKNVLIFMGSNRAEENNMAHTNAIKYSEKIPGGGIS